MEIEKQYHLFLHFYDCEYKPELVEFDKVYYNYCVMNAHINSLAIHGRKFMYRYFVQNAETGEVLYDVTGFHNVK